MDTSLRILAPLFAVLAGLLAAGCRPTASPLPPPPPEFASFYAKLSRSSGETPIEVAHDLSAFRPRAEEVVERWSLRQEVAESCGSLLGVGTGTVRVLLAAPGRYAGVEFMSGSLIVPNRWGLRLEDEVWYVGANGSSLRPAPFVSDGRGFRFNGETSGDRLLSANYRWNTPNPWGIHSRIHVVEATVLRTADGWTTILDAERVDGRDGPSATSLVLGMAQHFQRRADEDLERLRTLLRDAYDLPASESGAWMFPTFDAETSTLRVFFYRRVKGDDGADRAALAAMAREYSIGLDGSGFEIRNFSPRTEATWERPTGMPRSLTRVTNLGCRSVRVRASAKLDWRAKITTSEAWDPVELELEHPVPARNTSETVLAFDPRAKFWIGDETWWPEYMGTYPSPPAIGYALDPGPVRLVPTGGASQGQPPRAVELGEQVVDGRGRLVSWTPSPEGQRLPDMLLALHETFIADLDLRDREMKDLRDAMARRKQMKGEKPMVERVTVDGIWLPAVERVRFAFLATQSEEAQGHYRGGPPPEMGQTSTYTWGSRFAIVYELDLDGVVHVQNVYSPQAFNDWDGPPRP